MRQFSNIPLPDQIEILRSTSILKENKTNFVKLKPITEAIRTMGYGCSPETVLSTLPKAYPNLSVSGVVRGRNGGYHLHWNPSNAEKTTEIPKPTSPSVHLSPSDEPTDQGKDAIRETIRRIGRISGSSVEFSLTDFKKEMRSHPKSPCNYEECNNGHAKFHLKCVFPTARLSPGPARSGSTLWFNSEREMNDCLVGRKDIDTADCSDYRETVKKVVAKGLMDMVRSIEGL